MKTSIDLPDELYRRVKARSALEGRAVREVATELLSQWVDSEPSAPRARGSEAATPTSSADWRYEWAALGARIEKATRSAASKTSARGSKKRPGSSAGGLVEQLQRDRR